MINFVLSKSKNYSLVQLQINKIIQKHLPPNAFIETYDQYIDGAVNFTLFIDKEADVLMSHGAADKNYMWRRAADATYLNHIRRRKLLMVPGEFSVKRVLTSRLSSSGIGAVAVGWPRLDRLLQDQSAKLVDLKQQTIKRVLYAPTHDYHVQINGLVMSSYPEFIPYLEKLKPIFDVAISAHPRNRKDKSPTSDLLQWADVVISDHGTMVWEALALGKPVIFPSWLIGSRMLEYKKNSAEWHLYEKKLAWHASSFDDMVSMIQDPGPMSVDTKKFLDDYILPDSYGRSGEMIANKLLSLTQLQSST